MSQLPPADWYPDPEDPGQHRYWDGTQWTEHRAPRAAPAAPAASPPGPAWGQAPTAGTGTGTSGLAIASLIVGGVSFFLAFLAVGALGGIVAVVLGIVALRRVREGAQGGRGLAIGGIVAGGLAIALGIVMTIVFVTIGNAIDGGGNQFTDFLDCLEQQAQTGQDLPDC